MQGSRNREVCESKSMRTTQDKTKQPKHSKREMRKIFSLGRFTVFKLLPLMARTSTMKVPGLTSRTRRETLPATVQESMAVMFASHSSGSCGTGRAFGSEHGEGLVRIAPCHRRGTASHGSLAGVFGSRRRGLTPRMLLLMGHTAR